MNFTERGNPLEEAIPNGRRPMLVALRRRLAGILDGSIGHKRGCECECGVPWDTGKVAGISRELRETMRELEELPETGSGESELDRARAAREERRAEAARNAAEGE